MASRNANGAPRDASAWNQPSGIGRPCIPDRSGFNSLHPGGVMMAMSDGSVHFVNETIDYETWVYLGDRDDNEVALLP